jgi:hypothetical protein
MSKGKGAGSDKAAVKTAEADIRQGDIRQTTSLGDIVDYTTSLPIVLQKDARQHPDPATAQTVANMVFCGQTQDTICRVLKMGMDTLYKHYKHELETGQHAMVQKIAGSLAQRALAGSDTAAIFLLKTRGAGKFTERQTLDVSVEVTHKAELVTELAGMIGRGIVIDAEPVDEKKGA